MNIHLHFLSMKHFDYQSLAQFISQIRDIKINLTMKASKNLLILCSWLMMPLVWGIDSGVDAASVKQTCLEGKVDSDKKADLIKLRQKYPLPLPKASAKEMEIALQQLQQYQLRRIDNTTVKGNILPDKKKITFQQARDLAQTVRGLSFAALGGNPQAKANLYLYLDGLFTDNIIECLPKGKGSSYRYTRQIPADFLSALPICDNKRKERLIAAIRDFLTINRLYSDASNTNERQINSDFIYTMLPHLFVCALHHPNDKQAILYLMEFSRFLSNCTEYTPGTKGVLKPDGTGFHHGSHYNGYMYAYNPWVEYMGRLKGSAFRINKSAYERLRKAVFSLYLMSVCSESDNNRYFANSMAGRHPFYGMNVTFPQKLFELLIEVGGDVYGSPYDPGLASCYNYFYKTRKYANAPQWDANGFYPFNYSPAAVYRQDNWIAVMRCPTAKLWGAEIYDKTNRFGRYQSHGTLEVLYEGGLAKCGYPDGENRNGAGWDWNMMPGSTTVHYTDWKTMMPAGNDSARFDQYARTTNFSGAVAGQEGGIFAAVFDQGDSWGSKRFEETNLFFRKSVFATNGMLLSLGTDISAKGNYPDEWITATNLFQNIVSEESNKLMVNGKEIQCRDKLVISSRESVWMITPASTGYFVPSGHDDIQVIYGKQSSPPSSGPANKLGEIVVAKAFIHHGIKPQGKSYQFLVVPAATEERMRELATQQESGKLFQVMRMDKQVHQAQYLPSHTIYYSLFEPVSDLSGGILLSSETPLLILEQSHKNNGELNLNLCFPDLSRPVRASVELKGIWSLKTGQDSPKVFLKSNERGNTVLKADLSKGEPLHISLNHSSK
ncbi:chondroitinase family polysaccharide lyase [Akkermansia sp. N21116]|uniref:chondroitinase family polysaccharide lyase n=1 Tax=Akkermansia sp. N21116 TaxID=3040764 RepID=UPI00244E7C20|nr:chondroitinase family polysaccharide lyase [Akkermansia sp. N21116]WPX41030.1 chondroitinase family polysaccharide lyase [Akkermansia sp. N21116]